MELNWLLYIDMGLTWIEIGKIVQKESLFTYMAITLTQPVK